jgi:general secretion pathway protein H
MQQHNKNKTGFTLIELLVVMVVMGSLFSLAAISFSGNGPERQLKNETLRIKELMSAASLQAALNQSHIGFSILDNGYKFFKYSDDLKNWTPIGEGTFRARELPFGIILTVDSNSQVALKDDDRDQAEDLYPQIAFLSSYEITPFVLRLNHEKTKISYQLTNDGISDIKLISDNN